MARLQQLGDILGMGADEVAAVQEELAEAAFRAQVRALDRARPAGGRLAGLFGRRRGRACSVGPGTQTAAGAAPARPPKPPAERPVKPPAFPSQAQEVLRGTGTLSPERASYLEEMRKQLRVAQDKADKVIREVRGLGV
jgi:hypothetical protein